MKDQKRLLCLVTPVILTNAVNALAQLGISESQITRVDQASDTVEPGLVITQDPAPGGTVTPKMAK